MRDELVAPFHDVFCSALGDMRLKVINKTFRDSIRASASLCRNLQKPIKPLLCLSVSNGLSIGELGETNPGPVIDAITATGGGL